MIWGLFDKIEPTANSMGGSVSDGNNEQVTFSLPKMALSAAQKSRLDPNQGMLTANLGHGWKEIFSIQQAMLFPHAYVRRLFGDVGH
jgi:hypothetical protein